MTKMYDYQGRKVTVKEICKICGYKESTVRRWLILGLPIKIHSNNSSMGDAKNASS